MKTELKARIDELMNEYEEAYDDLNHKKANGNLGKLINLREEFDTVFDTFFDQEEIRKNHDDWDYEEEMPLLEKSSVDIISQFSDEEAAQYIEFLENYIGEINDEIAEIKEMRKDFI